MFTLVWVKANVERGGKIAVKADVKSLTIEHYTTKTDWLRFTLEVIFLIGFLIDLAAEILEMVSVHRKKKSFLHYLFNFWNLVDILSIGIMAAGILLW
jgi:hypothetical protein